MLEHLKFDEDRNTAIVLLDREIKRQSEELVKWTEEDTEVSREDIVGRIKTLVGVRNELKYQGKSMKGLDPTVLVSGAIGLVGIVMMLNFERGDIISSKSLPSIGKWFGM